MCSTLSYNSLGDHTTFCHGAGRQTLRKAMLEPSAETYMGKIYAIQYFAGTVAFVIANKNLVPTAALTSPARITQGCVSRKGRRRRQTPPLSDPLARSARLRPCGDDHPPPRRRPRPAENSRKSLEGLGRGSRIAGVVDDTRGQWMGKEVLRCGLLVSDVRPQATYFLLRLSTVPCPFHEWRADPRVLFASPDEQKRFTSMYVVGVPPVCYAAGFCRSGERRFERRPRREDGFPCRGALFRPWLRVRLTWSCKCADHVVAAAAFVVVIVDVVVVHRHSPSSPLLLLLLTCSG